MSVLITGANGFIASHIVDTLLNSGYTVIGTARAESKFEPLLSEFKKKYRNANLSYEVVADITAEGAFDDLLKRHPDIKYVLHTASPFSFGYDKSFEEAYFKPAVEGTKNVLQSIKKYAPQVTNVVVTSSFAAIMRFTPDYVKYTNQDWNPVKLEECKNEVEAYCASKTHAEKAAWDFVKNEKPNFKLTTVCPPYVFGPQVFDSVVTKTLNTSNELINRIVKTPPTDELVSEPSGLEVDVRDVAKFHQLAFEKESAVGTRLFVVAGHFTGQTILNILNKHFPNEKLAVGAPEKDNATELIGYDIDNVLESVGGYEFISLEKSIVDAASQYLKKFGSLKQVE
ncbi:hypothetical protein KL936_003460 [Ogataea polymorpha]|nr:hypothetical protein KL936_003460 [Ogataea polymorpha]